MHASTLMRRFIARDNFVRSPTLMETSGRKSSGRFLCVGSSTSPVFDVYLIPCIYCAPTKEAEVIQMSIRIHLESNFPTIPTRIALAHFPPLPNPLTTFFPCPLQGPVLGKLILSPSLNFPKTSTNISGPFRCQLTSCPDSGTRIHSKLLTAGHLLLVLQITS